MFTTRNGRAALLSGAAALALVSMATAAVAQTTTPDATPAQADQATQASDAATGTPAADTTDTTVVVVTGTSIRGAVPVGAPVQTLTRDDIKATGSTNVTEVLRAVPQVGSFNSTGGNTGHDQANFVDQPAIHGVGVGNGGGGLTLVLVNGHRLPGAGINQTAPDPSAIPASALQRVEVIADGASSIYGSDAVAGVINFITRRNFDGAETNVRTGFADGYRTNNFSQLIGRKWSSGSVLLDFEASSNTALNGSERAYYGDDQRAQSGADNRSTSCSPALVISGPSTYAFANGGYSTANTPALCDLNKTNDLYPSQHREQGMISLTQDLGDKVTFNSTTIVSQRHVDSMQAMTSGGNNLVTTTVSGGAFYDAAVALGAPSGTHTVTYNPSSDFGDKIANPIRTDTLSSSAGLDITINDSWKGLVEVNYGRERDHITLGSLNTGLLSSAISSGAFNPYGVGAANNEALIDEIADYGTRYIGEQTVKEFTAKFDGTLFEMPGGPVKGAFGVNFREERFEASVAVGDAATAPQTETVGDRKSSSAFAELLFPIVGAANAMPGLRKLDLSLAARYDDYNDVGNTTNPKLGINYKPIDDLTLHFSYGTSFHAPSLADAGTAIDTRAIRFADFTFSGAPGAYSVILAGGNKLEPEKAKTYTTGFDYKSSSIPGLRISTDFFHIDYDNVITFPGFEVVTLANNPIYDRYRIYAPTLAQTQAALAGFRHDGLVYPDVTNLPTAIYDLRRQNFASQKIEGFDFDVSANIAAVNVGVAGTYLTKFDQQINGDTTVTSRLDTSYAVKMKARAHAAWTWQDINMAAFVNYTGSYKNQVDNSRVDAFTTVDLHAAYDLSGQGALSDIQLAVDVSNLFDKDPPYVYDAGNGIRGVSLANASPLGRLVSVALTKKW